LSRSHQAASGRGRWLAASLREGLDETLTAQQLGLSDALYRTLRSTNPIENLNGSILRSDEDAAGRARDARSRCQRTLKTKGRVASPTRSRHLDAFNRKRDNASPRHIAG
jgi:hypothetical protein